MDKEKSLKKNKAIVSIAVLVSLTGLALMVMPYFSKKKDLAYEMIGFQIYDNDVLSKLDLDDTEEGDTPSSHGSGTSEEPSGGDTTPSEPKPEPSSNYIGTIEISKINLKKGFVDPSSKYNNIQYNVTILKGFDYPDVVNGNFILAAHSGTGIHSYFKDLYKLKNDDTVVITYKNKKYTYKIVKIYMQKKQGYLTIYRNVKKTTLTLITCTKDNKTSQTVYIAELV